MSGPIVPPLEVSDEADGGSVSGRPITTIEVTDGDLTISGRTATIDTSGSGGSPATPADAIQFNSDPAGTFTADAGFVMSVIGGGSTTVTQTGNILTGANKLSTAVVNGTMSIMSEGTGQLILRGHEDHGGTWTDTIVNIMSNANTDEAQLKFRDDVNIDNGSITLDGSGHMILNNNVAAKDIDLKVLTTGQVEVANQTTDTVSVLSILGNGTGDARIDMQNASERVWVVMDENKKLKIQGGSGGDTFVFDVSSATGGITFPDATTLVSAEGTAILATGVTDDYVLTADGAGAAAWEAAGGGGATELSGLSDVLIDTTEFYDGILIQPNSNGAAPTTGTLSSAEENVGIGMNTFSALTSGYKSVALGSKTMASATTAGRTIAIGFEALTTLESGNNNIGMGFYALRLQTGGNGGNSAVGASSGYNVTTGFYNSLYGYYSGFNISEGADNICIGDYSGKSLTTGDGCVFIGTETTADSATDDLQLKIAGAHSFGATSMTWISSDSTGSCYQGDNASSWSTTSDRRLKREIVDATKGLDAINQIRVRNFRYIEKADPITEIETDDEGEEHQKIIGYDGENRYNLDPEPLRVGVIAQELQEVLPEAVTENLNGHLTVNTDSINWALLRAVQELSAKVEALEANQ